MKGLSLLAGGELFMVDVMRVQKLVRNMTWTEVPAAQDEVVGIANLHGGVVTLVSLSALIGRGRNANAVHAVVFKPFVDEKSQMGLLVDDMGNIITIDEAEIFRPEISVEEKEKSFISGLTEIEGKFYRIIDIDLARDRIIEGGKKTANTLLQGEI